MRPHNRHTSARLYALCRIARSAATFESSFARGDRRDRCHSLRSRVRAREAIIIDCAIDRSIYLRRNTLPPLPRRRITPREWETRLSIGAFFAIFIPRNPRRIIAFEQTSTVHISEIRVEEQSAKCKVSEVARVRYRENYYRGMMRTHGALTRVTPGFANKRDG